MSKKIIPKTTEHKITLNTGAGATDTGPKQIGIYTLRGVENESAVKFGCLGAINDGEHIKDTMHSMIDISRNIKGEVYICNISGPYLLSNKTLPVLYIKLVYNKSIVNYQLLTMRLTFTPNVHIKSEFELLNSKITGTFDVDVQIDNEPIHSLTSDETNFKVFLSYNNVINRFESFLKNKEMLVIYDELVKKYDDNRVKKYNNSWDYEIPKVTISYKDL